MVCSGSGPIGWSGADLVRCDEVKEAAIAACKLHVVPSAEWVTGLLSDSASDVVSG